MRSKVVLILALVMGIITTALFFQYMKRFNDATVASTNTVEIVVAKQQIEKNERITSDKLKTVRMVKKAVHPEAVKNVQEIEGMLANSKIAKDEPLLKHRFSSEKDESTYVSRKVKAGYRAVSVGANFNQSVSNLIEPEDEVDVIFSKTRKEGSSEQKVDSKIILQKVRVLAVGRKIVTPEDTEEPYAEYSSVTLELKQEDSLKLVNSAEQGNIHFVLHQRPVIKEQKQAEAK